MNILTLIKTPAPWWAMKLEAEHDTPLHFSPHGGWWSLWSGHFVCREGDHLIVGETSGGFQSRARPLLISLCEVIFYLFLSNLGTVQYKNLCYIFRQNVLCYSSRYTLSAMWSCYFTTENKIIEDKMQLLSYVILLHECPISVCV
jgi:hypothetical protein